MTMSKSSGVTPSEKILASLCERTFLKLWSYPNPYKEDGKELCDLLVIFEDTAFIFFDRAKPINDSSGLELSWDRWVRRVIEAQVNTAIGAERYIRRGRPIFLDSNLQRRLPVEPYPELRFVHKIIIANGAEEACRRSSDMNVSGSLGISYGSNINRPPTPFIVHLNRDNPVHVFDSYNLPILLSELDTVWDFSDFLRAKLEAISSYDLLTYCGEEDLLAHYFLNFNEHSKTHSIGVNDSTIKLLMIGEGEWDDFTKLPLYERTKLANQQSYLWDDLIQRTVENAFSGRLIGDSLLNRRQSAIHEMAKEPRFSRRALAEQMVRELPLLNAKNSLQPEFNADANPSERIAERILEVIVRIGEEGSKLNAEKPGKKAIRQPRA